MIVPIYPALAALATIITVVVELVVFRTGIFRQAAYYVTLVICLGFMIPVDGWLTKLTAPVVVYREQDTSGWRPIWDILAEEYLYAFALLTMTMILWDHFGRHDAPEAGT